MSSPEEWIKNLNSADPLEKIVSRINLLRNWPHHREEDKQRRMYFGLGDIVCKHSSIAVNYVAGLEDIDEKAFAIRAIRFGIVNTGDQLTKKEQTDNNSAKKKLFEILEEFTGKLPEVENADSKADLARTIAIHCSQENALSAVDVLWAMGWNKAVYSCLYSSYGIETCSEVLTSIAINSPHSEVGKKSLNLISQVPNERGDNYLDKCLKEIILSKNTDIAMAAVDLLVKTKPIQDVASIHDIISVCEYTGVRREREYRYAQQPVVEYVFDKVIALTPEEQRMRFAHENVSSAGNCRPPGLAVKAYNYLNKHIDDINKIKDTHIRDRILLYLMQHGDEKSIEKAVDYVAQPPTGLMDGVENIAQLLNERVLFSHFADNTRQRIVDWAYKYAREFVKLNNKELAYNSLDLIKHMANDFIYRSNYIEPGTGKTMLTVAQEELDKLPKPKTKEEELLDLFGVKESKP